MYKGQKRRVGIAHRMRDVEGLREIIECGVTGI